MITPQELIDEAVRLGHELERQARRTREGSPFWLEPAVPGKKRVPLTPHLYQGTCGIALFLAALVRCTGDEHGFRELALAAIRSLRGQVRRLVLDPPKAEDLQIRLGGFIGVGSYAYSFLRVGQWLDEPELVAEAHRMSVLISQDQIDIDGGMDLSHGSAGALMVLLLLAELSEDTARRDHYLEVATACGGHLLEQCRAYEGEPPAWRANGNRPWCGFSHGAGGIALALARLGVATGSDAALEAARRGLRFERFHYLPEARNWVDFRSEEGKLEVAWCHGAAGIALSRLGLLDLIDDPEIPRELEIALETTRTSPEALVDFPCCGTLGRADILLYASHRLDEPTLAEEALQMTERVVRRALDQRGGSYRTYDDPGDRTFIPGFFTGASGIGYTLLRQADPTLPCVLILE